MREWMEELVTPPASDLWRAPALRRPAGQQGEGRGGAGERYRRGGHPRRRLHAGYTRLSRPAGNDAGARKGLRLLRRGGGIGALGQGGPVPIRPRYTFLLRRPFGADAAPGPRGRPPRRAEGRLRHLPRLRARPALRPRSGSAGARFTKCRLLRCAPSISGRRGSMSSARTICKARLAPAEARLLDGREAARALTDDASAFEALSERLLLWSGGRHPRH